MSVNMRVLRQRHRVRLADPGHVLLHLRHAVAGAPLRGRKFRQI